MEQAINTRHPCVLLFRGLTLLLPLLHVACSAGPQAWLRIPLSDEVGQRHISNRLAEMHIRNESIGGNRYWGQMYFYPEAKAIEVREAIAQDAQEYGHDVEFSDGTTVRGPKLKAVTLDTPWNSPDLKEKPELDGINYVARSQQAQLLIPHIPNLTNAVIRSVVWRKRTFLDGKRESGGCMMPAYEYWITIDTGESRKRILHAQVIAEGKGFTVLWCVPESQALPSYPFDSQYKD